MKAAKRNALPSSKFGLPDERKYPMPDKSHAANAKARASQQRKAGNITPAQEAKIDRKANEKLYGSSSSSSKGGGSKSSPAKGAGGGRSNKNSGGINWR